MYNVWTTAECKQAEQAAADYGLNEDILIENAAAAVYESICAKIELCDAVAVLVGGGNNGADGLSLARKLFLGGRKVQVFLVSDRRNAANAARLRACETLGVPITRLADSQDFNPKKYALIVDAMLGTGLHSPLTGILRDIVLLLNDSEIFTLAVDIPTGLQADTGEALGCAVIANETLTFSAVKTGHILAEGRNYTGNLVVADIGIRGSAACKVCSADDVVLPARAPVSHKYKYGRVCILGGSPEMVGAPLLACESAQAALLSGAGLVTLCVADSLRLCYQQRVRESTLLFLPDDNGRVVYDEQALSRLTQKTGAIALGMGMGKNSDLPRIIEYLVHNFDGTLVIDADGLNALAQDIGILHDSRAKLILTPHMGEFQRLAAGRVDTSAPLTEQVRMLAALTGAVIAAKEATTVISDGKDVFLNLTGTPAMAKGGSGDVLAGMMAAIACRLDPLRAALTACYHFGKCGETVERIKGSESVLASDLVNAIRLL